LEYALVVALGFASHGDKAMQQNPHPCPPCGRIFSLWRFTLWWWRRNKLLRLSLSYASFGIHNFFPLAVHTLVVAPK
jgi:hypothetical protein